MKQKIKLIKETSEKVILAFPFLDVNIHVSKRYFELLLKNNEYEIVM